MEYYRIRPTIDLEEIGDFLQIQGFKSGFESMGPKHAVKLLVKENAIDTQPVGLGNIVLPLITRKKTTTTDNTKCNE